MKKLLGILVLGLLWCNTGIADLKNIKTLADTCDSGYFKFGIYRHNTINYWTSDWESLQDQTVYYDSIVFRKPKKMKKYKINEK